MSVALLIALLLWAGSSGELRAVFAGHGESARASAAGSAQTLPAETIDSLLAKSALLPGVREAIEQAQPYAVNVCGLDKPIIIDPQAQEPNDQEKALQEHTDRALHALGTALEKSSDHATRALGLQIQATTEDSKHASHAQLFALAANTTSAYAYRVALKECNMAGKPGSCAQLSAKRLTELEPDNADSWLRLADEERAAKRTEAAAAAFARAAQAKQYDLHFAQPLKLAASATEKLGTTLERTLAPLSLFGYVMATDVPHYSQFLKHCEKQLVDRDPKRRGERGQLGKLMAESDTLISAQIGLAIKERVADPAAELEAIKIKRDALRHMSAQIGPPVADLPRADEFYSCEAARRIKDYIAKLIRVGEMGLVRQELQRQSLSDEQAAALYRARKAQ